MVALTKWVLGGGGCFSLEVDGEPGKAGAVEANGPHLTCSLCFSQYIAQHDTEHLVCPLRACVRVLPRNGMHMHTHIQHTRDLF